MNEKNTKKKTWKEMNFMEKCGHIRKSVTVEPMLACYIMPSVLANLATQNLNLEKACRVNLDYGGEFQITSIIHCGSNTS